MLWEFYLGHKKKKSSKTPLLMVPLYFKRWAIISCLTIAEQMLIFKQTSSVWKCWRGGSGDSSACRALGLSSLGQTEAKHFWLLPPGQLWQPNLHLHPWKLKEVEDLAWGFSAHISGKELVVKGYRIRELSWRAAPGGRPACWIYNRNLGVV